MDTQIFIPMGYLFILTFLVFLFSSTLRYKEIYINEFLGKPTVKGEEHRHPPFTEGSKYLKNSQRNLVNLFEFPVLFYIACILIFVSNNVDLHYIQLAYSYVYLRVLHSLYHIFFNHLIFNGGYPVRSFIWFPSTMILGWMWLRLSFSL